MAGGPMLALVAGDDALDPRLIRNIGIVAHIDAGKTTVSERLLFFSGVESRIGEVHEGSATMDWMAEERRRGITITSAATTLPWRDHRINLIDTPGHVDFTVEVERCLRVLDGAVLVLSAVGRVQPQSEAVWRQARRFGVPTFTFVNQCDRVGADFMATVADLESRLEVEALPIQYPIGEGDEHRGLVDLITGRALRFEPDGTFAEVEVPAEIDDEVGVLRVELVERLAELDEQVLDAHVEGDGVPPELVWGALRRVTLDGRIQPVLCGAALRNVGMQPLLDAVVRLLPSVVDAPSPTALELSSGGEVGLGPDSDEPACALVFKLQHTRREQLAFVRLYRGSVGAGDVLVDSRTADEYAVAGVHRLHADATDDLERAWAGDIVALTGIDGAATGDTLCAPGTALALESQTFSEPVLTQIVEPVLTSEREQLGEALERIASEDPTLRVAEDRDTGQWLLSGMGELHLEVVKARLGEECAAQARFGQPSVAFREAVVTSARGSADVERELGPLVLRGALELELGPDPGSGRFLIDWSPGLLAAAPGSRDTGGGELGPAERRAIEGALERAALFGPRFGFPLIHTRAIVTRAVGGGAQGISGNEAAKALEQCASIALREAMLGSAVDLLEPLVDIEVSAPADHAGAVLALLQRQKTRIGELTSEGSWQTIRGRARLSALEGFSTQLRSITQGRGRFGLRPAGFRTVEADELQSLGLAW